VIGALQRQVEHAETRLPLDAPDRCRNSAGIFARDDKPEIDGMRALVIVVDQRLPAHDAGHRLHAIRRHAHRCKRT